MYLGLLEGNGSEVMRAADRIGDELRTTGGQADGIKVDGAFFQHCHPKSCRTGRVVGPIGQLYSGGYGDDLVVFVVDWVLASAGTAFAPQRSGLAALERLLEAQDWMIAGEEAPHFDASVIGRELSRPRHRVRLGAAQARAVASLLPGGGASARALAARLGGARWSPAPAARSFYRADYLVARGPRYHAAVRMTSTRTMNSERVAGRHPCAGAPPSPPRLQVHRQREPPRKALGCGRPLHVPARRRVRGFPPARLVPGAWDDRDARW